MKHINCLLILILLILFFITLCRYYQKDIRKNIRENLKSARSGSVVREVVTPRPTKYIIPIKPDNRHENAISSSVVRQVVIPRVTPSRRS